MLEDYAHTASGLPRITIDTYDSQSAQFLHSLNENPMRACINLRNKIKSDDSLMDRYILEWVRALQKHNDFDDNISEQIMIELYSVHDIILRQAEANKLKDELKVR